MPGAVTNAGLDAIRERIQSDVAELAVGTGTSEPKKTDTTGDLSEVIRKSAATSDDGTGEAVFVVRLTTSEANGLDLTEVGAVESDDTLQARVTHAAIQKTSDFEVEYRLTERAVNA